MFRSNEWSIWHKQDQTKTMAETKLTTHDDASEVDKDNTSFTYTQHNDHYTK